MRQLFRRSEKISENSVENVVSFQQIHEILRDEADEIALAARVHSVSEPDPLAPANERAFFYEELARLHGRQDEVQRIGIKLVELYQKEQTTA
jgi:hypothetical protein